jgi:hypothetical protein
MIILVDISVARFFATLALSIPASGLGNWDTDITEEHGYFVKIEIKNRRQ